MGSNSTTKTDIGREEWGRQGIADGNAAFDRRNGCPARVGELIANLLDPRNDRFSLWRNSTIDETPYGVTEYVRAYIVQLGRRLQQDATDKQTP